MTRAILTVMLAAALGCAGAPRKDAPGAGAPSGRAAGEAPRGGERAQDAARDGGPRTARDGGPGKGAAEPAMSPRAQRLFEEAVQAERDQRKLAVPMDWPYLERKWRAVTDAGEVAEAHHNLAVALEAQGKLAEARASYERALALKPSLRPAAVNLAVLLEKQGDARAAAAAYAACIREFPDDGIARERLAALYLSTGQLDDAWRLAREALVREPGSVGAYRVLARVALRRKELDLAKLIAMRAQKLDPRDPELPFIVGQVLAAQGDAAAAQAQFLQALALREGFLPARYALLEAALEKQAWGAVAEQAAAILKLEPGNAPLQLVHGVALRYTGKPDEALAAYERAEKLGGDSLPEVHLARGVLLARVKSQCEPALAELQRWRSRTGPAPTEGAEVGKLQRECERVVEENRRAMEAARQMQAEAERQAAEKTAVQRRATEPAPSQGSAPAAPPPNRPR